MSKIYQIGFILLLFILPNTKNLLAQSNYPVALDPYINDYAQVIEPQDATQIRALLTDLKQQAQIEAIVLTINSMSDYQTGDTTIESFATHLFNTWRIGDAATNKGVLILVAVKDRKVRIELGAGYQEEDNAKAKEVITEFMLPAFKQNNYSQGIYQGTRAIVGNLTGKWSGDVKPTPSDDKDIITRIMSTLISVFGIFFVCIPFLIISAIITILKYIFPNSSSSFDSGSSLFDTGSSSFDSGSSSSDSGGSSDGGGASGDW